VLIVGGVGGSLPFAEYALAVDEIVAMAAVKSGIPLVPDAKDSVAGTPALASLASGEATAGCDGPPSRSWESSVCVTVES